MAHPVLHGPYVESPAQHSRGISRTKCLQIKFCRIEFGALRDRFAVVEHVLFAVSGRGWKHKLAVRAMRMLPKLVDEFHRSRNFTVFPSLRIESQFRFRGHPHSPQLEVDVAPAQEHHFLLAETGQQKRGEQGAFRIGARCKEAGKLLWRYIFTRGVMRSGSDSSRVIPLLP